MNGHQTELVSALLDGQLTGLRHWWVQRHVNRCAACREEYRQLQHVRELLAANPPTAQMPDPPEFFWSQVQRQIAARGLQPVQISVPRLSVADWFWQHQSAVASATTAAIAVAACVLWLTHPGRVPTYAKVEDLYTVLPDTEATAYSTSDTGTTVIWVSGLPWAPDMSEMKSQFDTQGI